MTRQIQLRRGTTSQHEDFTGAIGEVTMDIDKKILRVHDGQTPGGISMARRDEILENTTLPDNYDFVIKSGTTDAGWYRKYKSGWVEQGGNLTANKSITLPVKMRDTNYFITGSGYYISQTNQMIISMNPETSSTLSINIGNAARASWLVTGWAS